MFAIENKNNKQKINEPKLKMKKTKLRQSALYSFFLCDIAFFFLGRLRNPKSAFFLGKKWRKDNKETKKKQKDANCEECLRNGNKTRICKALCRNWFPFCLFLGRMQISDFGVSKGKETKRIQCKALWRNFFLICFFHFVCFCGLFFWYVSLLCNFRFVYDFFVSIKMQHFAS